MRRREILLFSLVALAALVLSACGGVIDDQTEPLLLPDTSSNTVENVEVQPDQGMVSDPPTSTGGEQQLEPPVVEGEKQPDQPDQKADLPARPALGFDLGESQLRASDPNQINLASGQPQLVELFAFW